MSNEIQDRLEEAVLLIEALEVIISNLSNRANIDLVENKAVFYCDYCRKDAIVFTGSVKESLPPKYVFRCENCKESQEIEFKTKNRA